MLFIIFEKDESTKNLQFCEKIESINVGFCHELTDEFVKYLVLSKCKLKEIIFPCFKIFF